MVLSWVYKDSELGAHYRGTIGSTLDLCIRHRLESRGPQDHINTRILQTMVSGLLPVLDLATRMDLYVYVVFWAPRNACARF